jgi:hypothetical protein
LLNFQTKYLLGQTKGTTYPENAINLFLKREFPQLLKCQTDPHEAFLVPDSFIYGGLAAKVPFFLEKSSETKCTKFDLLLINRLNR